jgi:hypothetical protein
VRSGSRLQQLFIKQVVEHCARDYRSKPKKAQVHIAQDEEEASLMLTMATLIRSEVGRTEAGSLTALAREVFYRNFGSGICGRGGAPRGEGVCPP